MKSIEFMYLAKDVDESCGAELIDGKYYWIGVHMCSYLDNKVEGVYGLDEPVLEPESINVLFDYPFKVSHNVKFTPDDPKIGFTRRELLDKICWQYVKIYESENDPGHIPGMLNRAESVGDYGIWGHDMSDLILNAVYLPEGKNIWKLSIDS